MGEQPMVCWTCYSRRSYPRDFPLLIQAKCFWCYPIEDRARMSEHQRPPKQRWWRSDLSRYPIDEWFIRRSFNVEEETR